MLDYDVDDEDERWLASLFRVSIPIVNENLKIPRKLINFDSPADLPSYPEITSSNGSSKSHNGSKKKLKNGKKSPLNRSSDNLSINNNNNNMMDFSDDEYSQSSEDEVVIPSYVKFTDQLNNFQCEIFELTISSYEYSQHKYFPVSSSKLKVFFFTS